MIVMATSTTVSNNMSNSSSSTKMSLASSPPTSTASAMTTASNAVSPPLFERVMKSNQMSCRCFPTERNLCFSRLTDIPCPPNTRLSAYDVFDSRGKPRVDVLKAHFIAEGRVNEDVALKIIEDGAKLLRQEKTMVDVEAPITGKNQCAANVSSKGTFL